MVLTNFPYIDDTPSELSSSDHVGASVGAVVELEEHRSATEPFTTSHRSFVNTNGQ